MLQLRRARAGEHGKGFAVVAEEVGNLAQMSGNASKEISGLLANSVERVKQIVAKTHFETDKQASQSKQRVEDGIESARRCGESLELIVGGTQKAEAMAEEIANASQEQATGVSEVSKAMHQLDRVTHENALASTSSAATAAQLSSQAIQMKDLVKQLYATILGPSSERDGRDRDTDTNSDEGYRVTNRAS